MPQQNVLILTGPTASGKSALAIKWAQEKNGAILNADAMQVYQGLEIITAQPSDEDKAAVRHRMYGYLAPSVSCSVALWLEAARIAIYETWQEGKLPIVVGGTGMYIKALMQGIAFIPEVAAEVREEVRAMDTVAAYRWLQTEDAAMAAKLKPNDSQRIKRAVEVLRSSGKSLGFWQSQPAVLPVPEACFEIYSLTLPRDLLYARCNARFETMLASGAIEEVQRLQGLGLAADVPAMRAVGVPELLGFLNGTLSLKEATQQAQQATRNYAKRQMTWMRHQMKGAVEISG